jgi:hypothetical protein
MRPVLRSCIKSRKRSASAESARTSLRPSFTDRLNKLNGKRNILVHGEWILEANVIVKRGEAHLATQFLRQITPTDPKDAEAMGNPRNQRERVRYSYNLKRVEAGARDTDALNRDFDRFTGAMRFKELSNKETAELLARSPPYRVTYSTP